MYLLTPFVDGGELFDWVHEHGATTEDVVKPLFRQVVQAVRVGNNNSNSNKGMNPSRILTKTEKSPVLTRRITPDHSRGFPIRRGAINRQAVAAERLPTPSHFEKETAPG